MAIVKHSQKKLSYSDYLAWKDDQRWEIIDGAPLLMFPAPNRIHQAIIKRIAFQIESYVQDKTSELFSLHSMLDWNHPKSITIKPFMWFNRIYWWFANRRNWMITDVSGLRTGSYPTESSGKP